MTYVYKFVGSGNLPGADSILANATVAPYLANIAPKGGITHVLNVAYICTIAPMSAAELTAWKAVYSNNYSLLGNMSGLLQDANVDFVSL